MPKILYKLNPQIIKSFFILHVFSLIVFIMLIIILLPLFLILNNSNNNSLMLQKKLTYTKTLLDNLKNQDQYKINQKLQQNIKDVENAYKTSVVLYERILDLKA